MTFVSPPCTNVSKVHPRGGAAISVSYMLAFNAVSLNKHSSPFLASPGS